MPDSTVTVDRTGRVTVTTGQLETSYEDGSAAAVQIGLLHEEILRLRATVDRLPKTAAGDPIVPGDRLWVFGTGPEHNWGETRDDGVQEIVVEGIGADQDVLVSNADDEQWEVLDEELFGTRQAAAAAKEEP